MTKRLGALFIHLPFLLGHVHGGKFTYLFLVPQRLHVSKLYSYIGQELHPDKIFCLTFI